MTISLNLTIRHTNGRSYPQILPRNDEFLVRDSILQQSKDRNKANVLCILTQDDLLSMSLIHRRSQFPMSLVTSEVKPWILLPDSAMF